MTPTDEQLAILDADKVGTSMMINALAGTGKSATLKLLDRAHKRIEPRLYLVFNRRNADEALAAQKADEFSSLTKIKTFNGCGHGIWQGQVGKKLHLDKDKVRRAFRTEVEDMSKPDAGVAWSNYNVVMDGIAKAKSNGYVPKRCKIPHKSLIDAQELIASMDEEPREEALDLIDVLLCRGIAEAYDGTIDFNDQIYMPACFGGIFPKFPRIMVDEYQDQNPVNHVLIAKLQAGAGAKLIGVGDPFQNIYGFRGAKAGGMADAVERYGMSEHPLSVSFRCPQAIVETARWRVPHFQWSKPGGTVRSVNGFGHNGFSDDATIICRNNAPLLRMAFKLLGVGRSVNVIGSDLGPRLVSVMKKLGDATLPRRSVFTEIEHWREQRLIAGSKSANDLADCMRVFAEHGDTLGQAISYAEHIFAQTGTIRLLTGHKAKGLEFDDVYFLDPSLCDDREQDLNLRYVIQTRSQNKLTMLDSSSILW